MTERATWKQRPVRLATVLGGVAALVLGMSGVARAAPEPHPAPARPAVVARPQVGRPGPVGRPGGPGGPGRPGGFGGRPGFAGRPGFGGRPGGFRGGDRYAFHGRDVRHFGGHDLAVWRGGHWGREMHDGRYGWWWNTGGAWYFYDQPVYPYPVDVSPVVFGDDDGGDEGGGPGGPPPGAPPLALPPPVQSRYYCSNPPGYYPAVSSCPGGFRPAGG